MKDICQKTDMGSLESWLVLNKNKTSILHLIIVIVCFKIVPVEQKDKTTLFTFGF